MLILLACTPEAVDPLDTADTAEPAFPTLFSDDAIQDIERAVAKDLRKNEAS